MFVFEKRTQIPVRIANRNPKLAGIILSQYGGPDGELAASLRYLSQRFTMPDNMGKALLTDIGSSVTKMFHVAKFAQKPLIFGLPLLSFESSEIKKQDKQDKIYSADKPFAAQKSDRIRYINVYASVKM